MGETFRLSYTVNAEGKDIRVPEIPDFEVLIGPSTSTNMSTQIINGKMTTETSLTFTYILQPKKEGTFNIAPATIKVKGANYTSNALVIKVLPPDKAEEATKGGSTGTGISKDDAFLTIDVSKRNVYEQEGILVTFKLYVRKDIGGIDQPKFPEFTGFLAGVVDDVNYDGSIKSLLFLLNTDCAVSIDKSQRFLSDLTGGKLKISRGMINKLCREFSSKTETERKKIFADLLSCPVLHTDCTNARVNGESAYVFVCASSDEEKVLYFAREKKGHEGVKGTVTEDFRGILVHDHEITFYRYGSAHQECLAHVERYLKDSMENESSLTWNRRMRELLQRMIHYRKEHTGEASLDAQTVAGFETEYQEILDKAKEEYKRNEPSPYYREGYNLYRRMQEYKTEHLLFLHDMRVPTTNNTAERCLRDYKRKQTFAMTFRSLESIEELCHSKGVLLEVRKNNPNIYTAVMEIFNRRYGA